MSDLFLPTLEMMGLTFGVVVLFSLVLVVTVADGIFQIHHKGIFWVEVVYQVSFGDTVAYSVVIASRLFVFTVHTPAVVFARVVAEDVSVHGGGV